MTQQASTYDVLLFDGYFCDLIITGLSEIPCLGKDLFGTEMGIHAGGAYNTVRALHRLGLKPGWVCNLGNDLFSRYVLEEIQREGVDTSLFRLHDHPVRALSLAFSLSGDRGFISYIDPAEIYDRVPYVYATRPACLLLSWLDPSPDAQRLVKAAREVGAQVLMDCQSTELTLDTPGVIEILQAVDVFFPNATEAMFLTGAPDVEQACEKLAEFTERVVVKNGEHGALARVGDRRIEVPSVSIQCVDSTGAGDCFNAGFLYGWLKGEPLERCIQAGNICGAVSTTAHGTIAAPKEEELLALLESHYRSV